jgi:hypothetical protein
MPVCAQQRNFVAWHVLHASFPLANGRAIATKCRRLLPSFLATRDFRGAVIRSAELSRPRNDASAAALFIVSNERGCHGA